MKEAIFGGWIGEIFGTVCVTLVICSVFVWAVNAITERPRRPRPPPPPKD